MGKLLKIVFGIIGVVLLLVVLAVGAFALFFDPNDFRSQITAAAKKATGRELVLGEIKLGVYPVLGANVKNVSLSNAAGFGEAPMVKITEADVGLRLLPLVLKREIQIGKISLTGLKLNLAKNVEGKSNWDDLAGGDKAAKPEEKPGEGPGIKSIDISGIVIKAADISYDDKQSGQAYAVTGLDLETGSISPGDPFDLKLAFSTTVKQPAAKADLDDRNVGLLALELQESHRRHEFEEGRVLVGRIRRGLRGHRPELVGVGDDLGLGEQATIDLDALAVPIPMPFPRHLQPRIHPQLRVLAALRERGRGGRTQRERGAESGEGAKTHTD